MAMVDEVLEAISEAEKKAGLIVDGAMKEARRIEQEARVESLKVYNEIFAKVKSEALVRGSQLANEARISAEVESEKVARQAETEVKNLRERAQRNMLKAVDEVFKEVISTEV